MLFAVIPSLSLTLEVYDHWTVFIKNFEAHRFRLQEDNRQQYFVNICRHLSEPQDAFAAVESRLVCTRPSPSGVSEVASGENAVLHRASPKFQLII